MTMLKQLFTIFFLFAVAAYTNAQLSPTACTPFHTGQFSYRDSVTNAIVQVKRTKKHQTEKNEKTGLVTKHRISWLSDCVYKLTQTWTSSKEWRKRNNSWNTYTIISVNENTYTYSCNCKDGTIIGGTMVKMRF